MILFVNPLSEAAISRMLRRHVRSEVIAPILILFAITGAVSFISREQVSTRQWLMACLFVSPAASMLTVMAVLSFGRGGLVCDLCLTPDGLWMWLEAHVRLLQIVHIVLVTLIALVFSSFSESHPSGSLGQTLSAFATAIALALVAPITVTLANFSLEKFDSLIQGLLFSCFLLSAAGLLTFDRWGASAWIFGISIAALRLGKWRERARADLDWAVTRHFLLSGNGSYSMLSQVLRRH